MGLIARLKQTFSALLHAGQPLVVDSEGRFEYALAHARTLYDYDPDSPWANYLLGYRHLEEARYADALPHLERAARGWPDNAQLWFAIGLCQDWLERPPLAVRAYERALAMEPDWAEALKNIGHAHYLLGDYPAAEGALRRYCEAAPDDREAHDLLGYICYRLGKFGQAYGHYERARRLDPLNPRTDRNARLLYGRSARS